MDPLLWGWWLSWSPFVGVFIARVSKDVQFVNLSQVFY